eukprot:8818302-Lingulodinium_polyedra.AAC.1
MARIKTARRSNKHANWAHRRVDDVAAREDLEHNALTNPVAKIKSDDEVEIGPRVQSPTGAQPGNSNFASAHLGLIILN